MPANNLTINQIGTVLQSVVKQATGQTVIAPTTTADFVTVATTALQAGLDPVLNALQQQISRTIFSSRPYSEKLRFLEMDGTAWGNYVRKISMADTDIDTDDQRYTYPVTYDAGQTPADGLGQSVDHYKIKKAKALETRFYGSHAYQDHFTLTRDALKTAFSSPDSFGSFLQLQTENQANKWRQYKEGVKRGVIANAIGAIIDEGHTDRVVHLLTEYNAKVGGTYTAQTIYDPAVFPAFMRWVSGRIRAIRRMMTERTQMYQTVVNGLPVMRHTPYEAQRMIMFANAEYDIDANVLSVTYHNNKAGIPGEYEVMSFWQSAQAPDQISVTPSYTDTNGNVTTGSPVTQSNVFSLLYDRDMMGVATLDSYTLNTPVNAAAAYWNVYNHARISTAFDCTEKGVVFLLD